MLTVKRGKKDSIIFPEKLISELGFKNGEKVNINIKKGAVVITKAAQDFLSLEGSLEDDDIETQLDDLSKDWKKWKPLKSL